MWLEILLPALLGGCLAGAVSLVVGGVGGIHQTRRSVAQLAELVGDLSVQIQREIKHRAGQASNFGRKADPLVEELARRAQEGPGSTIGGGAAMETPPKNGAEVLARARRQGVIR